MDGFPKSDEVALLVIDVQEKFRSVIFEMDRVTRNCSHLIKSCKALDVPVIHTEQYPKGLGPTIPELAQWLDDSPSEKLEFSCFRNEAFLDRLKGISVKGLVVCGIEAHVCVLQTVLDAVRKGYEVYLVEDAVSSRKESDWTNALVRAGQSGVFRVSTEMIIFQLLEKSGTAKFKEVQKIIK